MRPAFHRLQQPEEASLNSPSIVSHKAPRRSSWFALLLLAVVLLGLGLRLVGLFPWLDDPQRNVFGETPALPILKSLDGYMWLDWAEDIQEERYVKDEASRNIPQGDTRPMPPALISLLLAWAAQLTDQPLEWVALVMPVFLGLFIALPVFLLGREYLGRLGTLVAVAFVVTSPFYLQRTSIGWFDTDILNVTFAWLAVVFALRLQTAADWRNRSLWLLLALLNALLFWWWWHSWRLAPLAIALFPLAVALLLAPWIQLRHRWMALAVLGLGTLIVLLLAFFGGNSAPEALQRLYSISHYVAETARYPELPKEVVSEQHQLTPFELGNRIAGSWVLGTLCVLGLLGFVRRLGRRSLIFSALIVLACLGVIGSRFAIFAAPLFALGMGFLVAEIATKLENLTRARKLLAGTMTGLALGVLWLPMIAADLGLADQTSQWRAGHLQGMQRMQAVSEPDAVIWTAWDHGNLVHRYSRRGTLGDGRRHSQLLTYTLSVPLATESPRLAVNWIHFYVARGRQGLRQVIEHQGGIGQGIEYLKKVMTAGYAGAGDLLLQSGWTDAEHLTAALDFFFPPNQRPVYLFLTDHGAAHRWYRNGAWDFVSRHPPAQLYQVYTNLVFDARNQRVLGQHATRSRHHIEVDIESGGIVIQLPRRQLTSQLGRLALGSEVTVFAEGVQKMLVQGPKLGVLMQPYLEKTLFNRLYLHDLYPSVPAGFEFIEQGLPDYQIWRVLPQRYGD